MLYPDTSHILDVLRSQPGCRIGKWLRWDGTRWDETRMMKMWVWGVWGGTDTDILSLMLPFICITARATFIILHKNSLPSYFVPQKCPQLQSSYELEAPCTSRTRTRLVNNPQKWLQTIFLFYDTIKHFCDFGSATFHCLLPIPKFEIEPQPCSHSFKTHGKQPPKSLILPLSFRLLLWCGKVSQ